MPDSYQNPDTKPPVGGYTWVPKGPPTGKAVPVGFRQTSLERGRFRNDLPVQTGYSGGSLRVTYGGERVSAEGSEHWPVLNAFRPLQNPSSVRGSAPGGPFEVKGRALFWKVELVTTAEVSSITIDYALTVNLLDDSVFEIIPRDSEDGQAILDWRSDPNQPLAIEWSKYKAAKILVNDTEWPAFVDDEPVELGLTGYQSTRTGFVETRRRITVKFGTALNPGGYPRARAISIVNRAGSSNLKLALHKFMLFNAVRANIDHEQVPCTLLSYAFPIFFNWDPSSVFPQYPVVVARPNVHVKVFNPDYRIGSPGFAHSIYLRFLLYSQPIDFNILAAGLYFAVFIGPLPGRRNLRYSLLGQRAYTRSTGRVAPLDYYRLQPNAQTIRLQSVVSQDLPADSSPWKDLPEGSYAVQSPPAFNPILGPWLRPYTYYDTAGGSNTWYRSVQVLNTGGEVVGQPFKGSLFAERQALRLIDAPISASYEKTTLVRRVQLPAPADILSSEPVAVFVARDEERPYTSPITFARGAFNLAFTASSADPDALTSTHLYARIWFIPEDHTLLPIDIHAYRADTEIVFETNDSGETTLVRRAPRDISELIVSPPLPSAAAQINLVRYISAGALLDVLNSSQGRARMVVALYSVGYRTPAGQGLTELSYNVPTFSLEVDAASMYLETTLQQTLSETLFAQRTSAFNNARYIAYDSPLLASNKLVGGSALPVEEGVYTPYNKVFVSPANLRQVVQNAFSGLATLRGAANQQPARVAIAYADVPQAFNTGVFVAADFVTDTEPLMGGLVQDGRWTVVITINRDVDAEIVASHLRFEALLVSSNGRVAERIFRSPIIQDTDQNTTQFTYEADLQVPFLINNSDVQLVLRVYAYPHSRSGAVVNAAAVREQLGDLPLGLRIDRLEIVSHTLKRLEINQTDSLLGSPAFYEDLQLQPTRTIGDQSFWFVAADDLLSSVTVDSTRGWDVTGCVYSPTWFVNLPADMEVRSGAQGFRDQTVWFRTVPSTDIQEAGEFAITMAESEISNTVHVAYDEPATVTGSEVGAMSLTGRTVRHVQMDAPYLASYSNGTVTGYNANTVGFEGKSPNFLFMAPNQGAQPSTTLCLVAQADDTEGAAYNVAINPTNGEPDRWIGPNRDMSDRNFGANIRRLAQGMRYPAIARPYSGPELYVAGWVEPGTIVVKVANIFDTGTAGDLAPGSIYVVDGSPDLALGSGQEGILPQGELSGTAVETFVAVTANNQGSCIVSYALEGESGLLFARVFNGSKFSRRFTLVNMRVQGTAGSDDIAIYAPALAWNLQTQTGVVAFWCGGKIFVAEIVSLLDVDQTILSQVQLVAGSRDFAESANAANGHFAALKRAGALNDSQQGNIEADVPRQRCGLAIISNPPYDGKVFITYKDDQDVLRMREVAVGATVFAPVQVT